MSAELAAAARAALRISERRAEWLEEMREALLRNETERALMLARRLTGLVEDDGESDCPTPSLQ